MYPEIINSQNRPHDRMAEWHKKRMAEWQNGRLAEWNNGRMADWKNGRMNNDWEKFCLTLQCIAKNCYKKFRLIYGCYRGSYG